METRATYNSGLAITPQAFKNRACALPKESEDYMPPTPEEVKSLRQILGLSQAGLAKLVGVTYSKEKGSPTVRKWETSKDKTSHREINYASWQLMLIAAGIVNDHQIHERVEEYKTQM